MTENQEQLICGLWLMCIMLIAIYAAKAFSDLIGWTEVIQAYRGA